jgi:hypothetical protein
VRYPSVFLSALVLGLVAACSDREPPASDPTAALSREAMDSLMASAGGDSSSAPLIAMRPADTLRNAATLAELGYRDGFTLNGAVDQALLTIPVNRGRNAETLRLLIEPTPRMPDATLVLRQGDRVLAQRLVSDTTRLIVLPLRDAIVADGQAVVTLAVNVPGRDACEAPLFYRTVLTPTGAVEYSGVPMVVGGMSDFFPPLLERVTFYLPEQPSLDAAQAALDAAAFVARRYRGTATLFRIAALPPADSAIPEPSWGERAIVWASDGPSRILRAEGGRGTVLALASRRDARQLFTLAGGPALVPVSGFAATTGRLDDPATGLLSFEALGFGNRTITGGTIASAGYRFSLADIGRDDVPRAFRLLARHTAIPAGGVAEIAVLLNGSIVWSRPVESTEIDATIALPERLIARDNHLEVRFTLRLGEGECRLGAPLFTATIDGGSSLIVGGRNPLPPSFDRFPSALLPTFSVLLEPRDRYRVELAATTINAMQETTTSPLAPFVVRDANEVRGALLAVGTTGMAEALDAPLATDGFRLRDLDGRVWDEYRPTESYGAMQAYERNGRNVLLLHHTGTNGQPLADLLRESLAPYGWFGLHGDLALRGLDGPTTTLSAANTGWRLEPITPERESVLARWRSAIFFGAAILLLGLLIWLYPRVVRRELDPTG